MTNPLEMLMMLTNSFNFSDANIIIFAASFTSWNLEKQHLTVDYDGADLAYHFSSRCFASKIDEVTSLWDE